MLEKIKTIFREITEEDIQSLEKSFDFLLSDDYKKFLLEKNGGFPTPNVFNINIFEGQSVLDIFYGISKEDQYSHLQLGNNINRTRTMMPDEIIPIGTDPGGNYICLCVKGERQGKIYFFDHEVSNFDPNGNINWNNLYLISNSFTEFLNGLHS